MFYLQDIHLTASNDDQYFVFEDLLYQVQFSILALFLKIAFNTLELNKKKITF